MFFFFFLFDLTKILGDHIAYQYEIIEVIGIGSYAEVIKVKDHKEGKLMALKFPRTRKHRR